MALGKDSFYLGIFVILLMAVGLLSFGNELITSNSSLDNESISYISNYNTYYDTSGLNDITSADKDALQNDSLVLDQENTEGPDISDFLANLNYYKNRIAKIANYIKIVYNLPTFMLNMLGLPLEPFGLIATGLNTVLYIGLLIWFINKVRGS